MMAAISSGEGFDWYYANEADRNARIRTPLQIRRAAGKPWVSVSKDLWNWWANPHVERRGGAELSERPPAGAPGQSRSGSPNSAARPSTRAATSRMSSSIRNPQRVSCPIFPAAHAPTAHSGASLKRITTWWQGTSAPPGMVDPGPYLRLDWDARPFPTFPDALSIWSDGENGAPGTGLNGRMGATTLADAIAALLTDHGFRDFDVSQVCGDLIGTCRRT